MNKALKISLIAVGIIGAGVTTYAILKRKKNKREEEEEIKKQHQLDAVAKLEEANRTEASGATSGTSSSANPYAGYTIPVRNRNKEIVNPLSEIKGKMLYPAGDSSDPTLGYSGGAGAALLRSSAKVDNPSTWSASTNLLKAFGGRTPIGTVVESVQGAESPPMRWLRVKLKKPCCGIFTNYTDEVYVRADVVTFDKYKSASSAEGDMIQRYAPSRLGAEVFPHSNWMLPNQRYSGVSGNDFELGNTLTDLD